MQGRLEVTFLWYRKLTHNLNNLIYTVKAARSSSKTRPNAASLPFKGLVTEQTTVKWDLFNITCFSFMSLMFMYQSIPKPPVPPGQSPGIWLAVRSVQWGIRPKMRPARWGIWLSCQNVCQWSETKGFCNSLIQHVTRVQGSLLLSIPREFFCCCRFI